MVATCRLIIPKYEPILNQENYSHWTFTLLLENWIICRNFTLIPLNKRKLITREPPRGRVLTQTIINFELSYIKSAKFTKKLLENLPFCWRIRVCNRITGNKKLNIEYIGSEKPASDAARSNDQTNMVELVNRSVSTPSSNIQVKKHFKSDWLLWKINNN